MSFLGDLFRAGTGGTEDAGKAFLRAGEDFGKGDFDSWTNETENLWDGLADIPGTSFSMADGFYRGANGDLDWNPYSADNSVWDQMMGGGASDSESNRRTGRTLGSMIGGYFAAGGLGELLGSSQAGGAAAGALEGGARAAGTGGDSGDIFRGMAGGGMAGGGGSYLEGLDMAGNAGVTNEVARRAANRGLSSATMTAATPGTNSSDVGRSALYGAAQGGMSGMFTNNDANPYRMEYNPDTASFESATSSRAPSNTNNFLNNYGNGNTTSYESQSSAAPWAPSSYGGDRSMTRQSADSGQGTDYLAEVSNILNSVGLNKNNTGSFVEGLAGLYQANRQRKQAKELMAMVGGRRDAYGTQLRRQLERRDAAAGRRSDYGGRETQLQAGLAELDSRNAPGMMQLSNLESLSRLGMLQSGLRTGSKLGWFNTPQSLSQLRMPQFPQMQMPDVYQPQTQIDPMNWDRQRRLDQFGG